MKPENSNTTAPRWRKHAPDWADEELVALLHLAVRMERNSAIDRDEPILTTPQGYEYYASFSAVLQILRTMDKAGYRIVRGP